MTLIQTLWRWCLALPAAVASLALFALMLLGFADVVLRSAFDAPIEAATELIRIAVAITVFAALPLLSMRGGHIVVDLLDPVLNRLRLRGRIEGLMSLISGALLFVPAERVRILAERARDYGDRTEYLGIPTYLIGWMIAVLCALAALAMLVRGAGLLLGLPQPEAQAQEMPHD